MSTYISRRVQGEINRDWDNNDSIVFFDSYNNDSCKFIIFEDCLGFQHPFFQITIDFKNSGFPFKPPTNIKINTLNYFEFIKCHSDNYKHLYKIIGKKCLCCSSLLCRNNWNVQISMKKIINEIIENIKIKQRLVEIIHSDKIIDKYFGFYLPITEYL
tara:strand:- start:6665 stop:7138 length:474 start_codon:yes stop_codon:yes gene_type:complete